MFLRVPVHPSSRLRAGDGIGAYPGACGIRVRVVQHGDSIQRRSWPVESRRDVCPLPLRHLQCRGSRILNRDVELPGRHARRPRHLQRHLHRRQQAPESTTDAAKHPLTQFTYQPQKPVETLKTR